MKAYVLRGIGELGYEEVRMPEVGPGWALVKVKAAGICSSDIPRIFENGAYHFPMIPGHEVCGVVSKVYDREKEHWLGKRVGVFPLIPCRKCRYCLEKRFELCRNYDYIGSRRDGGFGEYVAVPVWNLIELDSRISYEAAALLEPASVALHAVRRSGRLDGARVCVVGTGSIGFLAAQWARLLGAAEVCVQGRDWEKFKIAQACGLEYRNGGQELLDRSFDLVFEAVGSGEALRECIRIADGDGEIVLIGNPSGDQYLEKELYWKILRRQLKLTGTWNSAYDSGLDCDWTKAMGAMADKSLNTDCLITHVLEQDDLAKGLQIMRDKTEACCKVVVRFS